ncbi:hypothetical protein Gpo141_00006351 [Globisporangium polare]
MHVERVDAQLKEGRGDDASQLPSDSFRKLKWLQHEHALNRRIESAQRKREQDKQVKRDAARLIEQQMQLARESQQVAEAKTQQQAERRERELEAALAKKLVNRRDTSVPLEFEEFLEEIVSSGVDVSCSQSCSPLEAKTFDQLGAISVPCRREGNSLTLCCWLQPQEEDEDSKDDESLKREQLVVFGGRVLQDVTRLLPAAVLKDPMKLERVRYTYSNGVYSYDIATSVWKFHECSTATKKAPRERSDHSAVFLEPHFLLISGGRGRNGQIFKDLFALDLSKWQWQEIDTSTTTPIERYWHACCVSEESVFVLGGKSEVLAHGDLQQLSAFHLRELLLLDQDAASQSAIMRKPEPKALSWVCPHTVGKAPSPRFGHALLALDYDRIAVVGGYKARKRKPKKHELQQQPRLMDFHILDTVTMIWSTPRLSSHVSTTMTTPPERMLFECFYQHNTVIVFGGFTYATNGETESYAPREDAHVVYKLDVNRMIWRRQSLVPAAIGSNDVSWLPAPHVHGSSNAMLGDRGFTCFVSEKHTLMDLVAFHVEPKRHHDGAVNLPDATGSDGAARNEPLEQQADLSQADLSVAM